MIWTGRKEAQSTLPPVVLEGFRVAVRPPEMGDWQSWAEIRGKNRDFLKSYEPVWPENCLTKAFYTRRLARQAQDWSRDRAYAFLICERLDNALIGGVNINNVCRGAAQYATLGYWLDEERQGQGYMAEALRLVIGFGFDKLKLHRFNASCLTGNERSRHLLRKLGFTEEGFAEKYVQINGRWQDHRLFGLPVENWRGFKD